MNPLVLWFQHGPATDMPHFTIRKGTLPPAVVRRLEGLLRRHYQRLAEMDHRVVRFPVRLTGSRGAACFRIRVDWRVPRCPTLWLKHVPKRAERPGEPAPRLQPAPA